MKGINYASKVGSAQKDIRIAIAGQPNTGKSTLFNRLSGSNQHVGNWPGKTIERKTGRVDHQGDIYTLVDLPGTYSLTANSSEEMIARDYILFQDPDLAIIVVDASQLSRSLYMVTELLTMGIPIIMALNMMDVAEKKGLKIDIGALESSLGLKVVPLIASKNIGVSELMEVVRQTVVEKADPVVEPNNIRESFPSYPNLQAHIDGFVPEGLTREWTVQKLMENDLYVTKQIRETVTKEQWKDIENLLPGDDQGILSVAADRYDWISRVVKDCVAQAPAIAGTKRGFFDRVATHPIFGVILSLLVITVGCALAMSWGMVALVALGPPITSLIQSIQSSLSGTMPILSSFITEGIIPAAFLGWGTSVFIFGILLLIGILEDVGYLPRMAFTADIFMNRIGLHGKAFMPMFMGLGCNIVSVMGSRVVDSPRQRFKTIVLSSHMPCQSVLATIAFMIAIFFGPVSPVVALVVAVVFLLQLYITSVLLDRTVLKGTRSGMMMELPPYHRPNLKTIWNFVWIHYKAFLKRAGTLIVSIIILIWALSYFPNGNMTDSYLASIGRIFEPIGSLMGMDWKLLTCLFVASFSKEAGLISMGVMYGIQIADGSVMGVLMDIMAGAEMVTRADLGTFLFDTISKPSALAFVFAILFSIPCFATIGVIFNETKSLKWAAGTTAYFTLLCFIWGIAAYQVGLLVF